MTIKTHNGIALAGETDNGVLKQSSGGGAACQFFFPCDDTACVGQVCGAVTGVPIPGETMTHAVAGTAVFRAVTGSSVVVLTDQSSWSTSSGTATGAISGATIAACNGTLYTAVHDIVGGMGYAADTCAYTASPLYFTVTLGGAYHYGTAMTAPGTNSCMLAVVAQKNTSTGNVIINLEGTSRDFYIGDNGTDLDAVYHDGTSAYTATASGSGTEGDATVHCYAIVMDRTANLLKLYLDAVLVASVDITGAASFSSLTTMDWGPNTCDTDFYGVTMYTWSDGVPSDLTTWLAEFKTNMTGTNTEGARKLPNRWISQT